MNVKYIILCKYMLNISNMIEWNIIHIILKTKINNYKFNLAHTILINKRNILLLLFKCIVYKSRYKYINSS